MLSSALMVLERVQQFLLSVVSFTRIVELMDDSITSRNKLLFRGMHKSL